MKSKAWWIWGAVVLVGVGVTLMDYRAWKRAELEKYGHGYEETGSAEPVELVKIYEHKGAGLRLKLPENFLAEENAMWSGENTDFWTSIKENERRSLVKWGQGLEILAQKKQGTIAEVADEEIAGLARMGVALEKEREYLNTQKHSLAVVRWRERQDGQEVIRERVLGKNNDRMIVLDVRVGSGEERPDKNTFKEIYQSLVIY